MYEANKLSNFLTLLIMIVVLLAVYKTCTKNRENQSRIDFTQYPPMTNAEYMQPDHGANNDFAAPPPPYGYDSQPAPNPPGFKPEFTNQQSTYQTTNPTSNTSQTGNTLGNMLVGAAIGGLGSYLFTSRRRFLIFNNYYIYFNIKYIFEY